MRKIMTNCNHEWMFNEFGYSHCVKCGCARETGKCIQCGKEGLNMKLLVDTRPYKFCDLLCIKKYLEEKFNI